eukprot:2404844-Amphidinium_carterae.2
MRLHSSTQLKSELDWRRRLTALNQSVPQRRHQQWNEKRPENSDSMRVANKRNCEWHPQGVAWIASRKDGQRDTNFHWLTCE